MNLEELKKQERELNELLRENKSKQDEIIKSEFVKKFGFNVGDIVEYVNDRKVIRGIIDRITINAHSPQYIVKIINSDGKAGKRETRIWSWNLSTMQKI